MCLVHLAFWAIWNRGDVAVYDQTWGDQTSPYVTRWTWGYYTWLYVLKLKRTYETQEIFYFPTLQGLIGTKR